MVTAPANPSTSALRRALPVVGVLIALGVAVGAWLLPRSAVEPVSRAVTLRGDNGAGTNEIDWIIPQPEEWTALAVGFDTLREPDREEVVVIPPGGDDGPETPIFVTPARVLRPTWSYEGFIGEPNRRVAVIRTRSGQRLVYEGDTIVNPDDPSGSVTFVVEDVTPESMTLVWEDNRFDYSILDVTPRSAPSGLGGGSGGPRTDPAPAIPPTSLPEENE